ncbi:hypothetical protein BCR39DRAFT_269445 [Naematelia encephala]|uniref:Uncharacterized protein n=1 Tax=Naematelia encephala TaxID=71784 RepID=A0A1Y2AU93_9TREE|nr:hypothetical protein BCR39DRAFT_269445 [Naematelia encephala]
MVKSHRSPSTFFHQWPTTPSHHDHSQKQKPLHNIAGTPGSPFSLDPFGSQVTLPEPIRSSRPNSITSATQLVHGSSTTPKIVLASPSTSTIHYLFPSSETRSNLSTSTTERPKSVRAKSRPPITARRSFEQVEKEKTAQRKILEGSFPLPPSRREPEAKASERYREPLGSAKRVPSGTLSNMPTLKRQPSMADLGKAKGMKVDIERVRLTIVQS